MGRPLAWSQVLRGNGRLGARSGPALFLEFVESLCAHELFELPGELRRIKGVGGWRPAGLGTAVRHGRIDTREEIGLPSEEQPGCRDSRMTGTRDADEGDSSRRWKNWRRRRGRWGRVGDDDGRRPQQHSTAESVPRLALGLGRRSTGPGEGSEERRRPLQTGTTTRRGRRNKKDNGRQRTRSPEDKTRRREGERGTRAVQARRGRAGRLDSFLDSAVPRPRFHASCTGDVVSLSVPQSEPRAPVAARRGRVCPAAPWRPCDRPSSQQFIRTVEDAGN